MAHSDAAVLPQKIAEANLGLKQLFPLTPSGQPSNENRTLEYDCKLPCIDTTLTSKSIVAIHGKGAEPSRTWGQLRAAHLNPRDPDSYVNWLDDDEMLPAEFPTARIFRFGYLSEYYGEERLSTRPGVIAEDLLRELHFVRRDTPKRPLIFLAHSFGGLVLMKVASTLSEHILGSCSMD